jgi:hypothetical protein
MSYATQTFMLSRLPLYLTMIITSVPCYPRLKVSLRVSYLEALDNKGLAYLHDTRSQDGERCVDECLK